MSRKTSEERRKEVVDATLELVGEEGVGSLRTSQIADRVGFSEAALYKHFPNKKEIIRATIQTAGNKLIESLTKEIEETDTKDNLSKLRKAVKTHLKFISEQPGITRLLFSDEVHFNEKGLRNELLKVVTEYKGIIKNLLEDGIAEDQIKKDTDPDAAFTIYFGIIQSQILFWSLSDGKNSLGEQVDVLWKHYKRLVGVGDHE